MRPASCALVVTVPLERAEFMADLAAGTDFLEQFTMQQRSRNLDVLWSLYEAGTATAAATIARVQRRGVTVCKRSTSADFIRSLEQHSVVTLVAHWRTARFRASEILDPGAVHRFLGDPGIDGDGGAAFTAAEVGFALNQRLDSALETAEPVRLDDSGAGAAETRRQYALWHARRDLEPRLGQAVRAGGPAVEFADGLMPVERVVSAVPEGFSGVLDLTVCNSTLLAEEIRRRCRRGLIIANAFPATLHTRMEFYDAAMELVRRRGLSYQDAVFIVRRRIRSQS